MAMASSSSLGGWNFIVAFLGDTKNLKELEKEIGTEELRKKCNTEVNTIGLTVLHCGAMMGMLSMVKFLIEDLKVDINKKTFRGFTPLLAALKAGEITTATYLIKCGADIALSNCRGFTALHLTAILENTNIMDMLVERGADMEAHSVVGTPLHCAAKHGKIKSVQFLLDKKAEVDSVSKQIKCTPLVCAIFFREAECAKRLLKAKADPNQSVYGLSALALAAEKKTNCIEEMVNKGADTDSLSMFDWKPIEHAAWEHNFSAVKKLLPVTNRISTYPDWSKYGLTIKMMRTCNEIKENRKQLCSQRGAAARQFGDEAFLSDQFFAAVERYNEVIFYMGYDEELLARLSLCWQRLGEPSFALIYAEKCVELKGDWAQAHLSVGCAWTMFQNHGMAMIAFQKALDLTPENEEIRKTIGNKSIVRSGDLLFDFLFAGIVGSGDVGNLSVIKWVVGDGEFQRMCIREFDTEGDTGYTALHIAASRGKIGMCTFFIDEVGLDVDVKTLLGDTPLITALKHGQHISAKHLIEREADIDTSNLRGYTPLHCAVVSHNNTELLKLLLERGANIEANYVDGTPLHSAVRRGKPESVKFLLCNKAEVNAVSKRNGCTPLVSAIHASDAECVKLLLEAGANLKQKCFGLSPLIHAAEKHASCIKPLLDYGADPNSHSWVGWTAIEHAAWNNNVAAIRVLLPATKRISSYSKWNISTLIDEIHSGKNTENALQVSSKRIHTLDLLGNNAFSKERYSEAVRFLNENRNQSDENILASRSLCWEKMGDGVLALADAEECVTKKKDWPMAHFRVGCAWNILEKYTKASEAFIKALELDPENEEFRKAYRESTAKAQVTA